MGHREGGRPATRQAALYAYRIPLTRPLRLGGRDYAARSGLLLRLRERAGEAQPWREGVGEAAPLPGFSPDSAAACRRALIAAATAWLSDSAPVSLYATPAAAYAFDCARLELTEGPLCWPAAATIDPYPLLDGPAAALLQRWRHWPGERPGTVKLKVARRAAASETGLIRALLQVTPALRLRLDANGGWRLADASAWCDALSTAARAQIEYLEEPCATLTDSLALAARFALPLALDESLRRPGNGPVALPDSPPLATLILKPAISGGLDWLRAHLLAGRQRGLRCVLSSSFQSSLGCGQLAALAARWTPSEPPGLDTLGDFGQDLLRPGPHGGRACLGWEDLECRWPR